MPQRSHSGQESHIDPRPPVSGMKTTKPTSCRELLLSMLDLVNTKEHYELVMSDLAKLVALEAIAAQAGARRA